MLMSSHATPRHRAQPANHASAPVTGKISTPVLRIEHVITADDPLGEPWPPDGSCSIVRRASNGFTLWRTISFGTHASATPPAPRDPSLGGNEKQSCRNIKQRKT
jgi:hypothetical protein